MYGGQNPSDENATRVAGNELRGLISYYKVNKHKIMLNFESLKKLFVWFQCGIRGLSVPLMALIDYRGYRLVACSLLPIG